MINSQRQEGGDQSVNIQGRDISIGLSYGEARQVAMDVFEANFYRLSSIAADVARERAESFLDAYLSEAKAAGTSEIPEAENPDFQYALYTAQKEFAKTGDKDLGALLVRLLVDRTKEHDRTLLQIVLNESLTVAPKLTSDQLDALSLAFLIKHTRRTGMTHVDEFGRYFDKVVLPFVAGAATKTSSYQHLAFASCAAINTFLSNNIESIVRQTYPGLFQQGFTEDRLRETGFDMVLVPRIAERSSGDPALLQFSVVDNEGLTAAGEALNLAPTVIDALVSLLGATTMGDPQVKARMLDLWPACASLFEKWTSTPLTGMTLTSVGIAIAHANIQCRTGESFDLSIWI